MENATMTYNAVIEKCPDIIMCFINKELDLEKDPIRKISAEKQLKCINHKLKIRTTEGLKHSWASLNVKAQSYELAELDYNISNEYRKLANKKNLLMKTWNETHS